MYLPCPWSRSGALGSCNGLTSSHGGMGQLAKSERANTDSPNDSAHHPSAVARSESCRDASGELTNGLVIAGSHKD